MENAELIALWKEIKALRSDLFVTTVHVEALRTALSSSNQDFENQSLQHRKTAERILGPENARQVNAIDDIIQRLESA